jgi:uncharacterized protein (DUF2062 family)
LRSFWERKIVWPIIGLLKQGMTPEKIALGLALGIVLGIFPVIGMTTLLCTFAALLFRVNLPAIQVANYLAAPLQLALLLPFYRAGEWLFHAPRLPLSVKEIAALIEKDMFGAMTFLWDTTLHAVVAWTLIAPVLVLLFYHLFKPALHRLTLRSAPA